MLAQVFITGYGMRPMDKPLETVFRYARLLRHRGISPVYISFGIRLGGPDIAYKLKRAVAPVPVHGGLYPSQTIEEAENWVRDALGTPAPSEEVGN